jgi:hypothetical protein
MLNSTTKRLIIEAVHRTCYVGLGTTGGETSTLARNRSVERLLNWINLGDAEERETVRNLLLQLFPILVLDSDNRRSRELQPAFHSDEPERSASPLGYRPLPSPGGHEIIKELESPPYRHMQKLVTANRTLVEQKSANSEAQSCRWFGAANAYADILRLDEEIASMLLRVRNLTQDPAWSKLRGLGFPLMNESIVINVCGSGAGGQATGLFVLALVLLNLRMPLSRSNFKVAVDFMNPGFLQAQNAGVAADQRIKSLRVYNDLAALRAGYTVEIPHPHGALTIGGAQARDILDEFYLHLPRPTNGDAFASFISSVATLMVDRALSPYAGDWQASVANDPYLATIPALV